MATIEIVGNMAWIVTNENLDEELVNTLKKVCSYIPPSAGYIAKENIKKQEMRGVENPVYDVEKLRTVLFNSVTYSFPAGLAEMVRELLLVHGVEVDIVQEHKPTVPPYERFMQVSLSDWGNGKKAWEHQLRALEYSCHSLRGIFQLPTGSGKTTLGLKIWEVWGHKLALVLAPTTTICEQWVKDIKTFYPERTIGYWFGHHKKRMMNINIMTNAMAQSILKNPEKHKMGNILLKKVKFVLVDECHHVGGSNYGRPNSLYNVLISLDSVELIFGLTATAKMRTDDSNIYQEASIGGIIMRVEPNELVEKGILVPPKIKFALIRPISLRARKTGTKINAKTGKQVETEPKLKYYKYQYRTAIVNNEERNMRIIKEAIRMAKNERRVIIFTKLVEHINEIFLKLSGLKSGLEIAFSHGQDEQRVEKLTNFRDGNIDIMIVTNKLLGEGLNIPAISGIVYAIGEKSETAVAQAIGRAMRNYEGKFDCQILELADSTHPFSEYTTNRLRYYIDNGYKVDLSECKWLERFI